MLVVITVRYKLVIWTKKQLFKGRPALIGCSERRVLRGITGGFCQKIEEVAIFISATMD